MPGSDKSISPTRLRWPSPSRRVLITLITAICVTPILSKHAHAFVTQRKSVPSQRAPPLSELSTRSDWTFASAPAFCKKLVAEPVQQIKCKRDRETQACEDGRVSMMSQFFQDYYLYTRHFSKLKRRGVYLDVAANDPIHLSNSFFMDTCLGWDGLCVEANPDYIHKLRAYRSCRILPTCVGDRHGQKVKFVLGGGSGGIQATNKHMEQWKKEGREHPTIELECTTIARTLERMGVAKVDYLSLDVEGHEMQVLRGIDWDKVRINVMTIEVSPKSVTVIEEFLSGKGYVRHVPDLDERTIRTGILYYDAVFVHKTVTFGEPE